MLMSRDPRSSPAVPTAFLERIPSKISVRTGCCRAEELRHPSVSKTTVQQFPTVRMSAQNGIRRERDPESGGSVWQQVNYKHTGKSEKNILSLWPREAKAFPTALSHICSVPRGTPLPLSNLR